MADFPSILKDRWDPLSGFVFVHFDKCFYQTLKTRDEISLDFPVTKSIYSTLTRVVSKEIK